MTQSKSKSSKSKPSKKTTTAAPATSKKVVKTASVKPVAVESMPAPTFAAPVVASPKPTVKAAPVVASPEPTTAAPAREVTRAEFMELVRTEAYRRATRRNFRNGSPFQDWVNAEAAVSGKLIAEGARLS